MSYTCRLFLNTGFNSVNIPYSPSLVESALHIDPPALQILQDGGALTHIDVKVTGFSQVENVDYAKVGKYYYFVDGGEIVMLNADTARIPLYMDFLTSLGGVAAIVSGSIKILDGITSRVHVSDDAYGKWCEVDPYMAPAKPLKIQKELLSGSDNYACVVKSTLDLSAMGTATGKVGTTYEDAVTGETVIVPATIANTGETDYAINTSPSETEILGESRTRLFDVDYNAIKKALNEVNDLATNGSVTAQVLLPLSHVILTIGPTGTVTKAVGKDTVNAMTTLPFIFNDNVRNQKINYSEYCLYGIATASGDKKEYVPADIYTLGLTQPVLRCISDPRTDGKPYYRWTTLNGDSSMSGFFREAVEGMPWKQVPLVYEGMTGKALAQLSHNQALQSNAFNRSETHKDIMTAYNAYDTMNAVNAAVSVGSNIAGLPGIPNPAPQLMGQGDMAPETLVYPKNGIGKGIGAGVFGGAMSALTAGAEYAGKRWLSTQIAQRAVDRNINKQQFERRLEQESYFANTMAYSPTVQFPFSSDLYNDMYNNPCLVYRYIYDTEDAARIDKILTMYGYKATKTLDGSTDFNNRQYFNYIEASVSLGGNHPRWMLEGAAAQISGGIRIWKVKPDSLYYANNPIAS